VCCDARLAKEEKNGWKKGTWEAYTVLRGDQKIKNKKTGKKASLDSVAGHSGVTIFWGQDFWRGLIVILGEGGPQLALVGKGGSES